MKKISYLLLICLILSFTALAQDYKGKGRVKGLVTDEQGNPIEGVKVKLFSVKASQAFTIETDEDGVWHGNWIRNGTWNVDFEKLGYAPKKISMQISEFKKNPDIEVALKKVEGLIISKELEEKLIKGNELFDQENYDEAIAVFAEMLAENPDAYIVNQNIGNCYFQQEKYEQAAQYYKKILEKDADNTNALLSIGNSFANMGENETAMEWYVKVGFEKLDDPTVLYNIGTSLFNMAKYDEALKYYERSVEIQADFLDGIYQLGLVYLTTGNNDSAIIQFEKYLEFDSESGRAEQVQGFLDYLK
jgi:tetratricopeptide (TPR) repeat protein